jgi:putative copper export protein
MTTASKMGHDAGDAARATTQNKYFQVVGRVGLAAYGVVHFTIAVLAARVALGAGGEKTDKGGALQALAAQPGGRALLRAVTVGLAMLVLWRLGEAAVGLRWVQPQNKRTRKRIESAATAVVFGVLAVSAGRLAAGGGAGSDQPQEAFTARVLALPFGQVLVGAAGAFVIVVGAVLIYRGVRKKFLADLDLSTATPPRDRSLPGWARPATPPSASRTASSVC